MHPPEIGGIAINNLLKVLSQLSKIVLVEIDVFYPHKYCTYDWCMLAL